MFMLFIVSINGDDHVFSFPRGFLADFSWTAQTLNMQFHT